MDIGIDIDSREQCGYDGTIHCAINIKVQYFLGNVRST